MRLYQSSLIWSIILTDRQAERQTVWGGREAAGSKSLWASTNLLDQVTTVRQTDMQAGRQLKQTDPLVEEEAHAWCQKTGQEVVNSPENMTKDSSWLLISIHCCWLLINTPIVFTVNSFVEYIRVSYPSVPLNCAFILSILASQVMLLIFSRPSSSLIRLRMVLMFTPSAEALMFPVS